MSLSSRPQFEPVTSAERAQRQPQRLLPWLRLMRLPNVFTALADVTMGYLFVRHAVASAAELACLAAASAGLYVGGMVLNDLCDFEIDLRERPFRPLPSGQVSFFWACLLASNLIAAGFFFSWLAAMLPSSPEVMPWRSGLLGGLLAAFVLAYNLGLKKTFLGPLAMGACRFFNVLLGMSAGSPATNMVALGYGPAELLAAGGIGIYIVGVTYFAKGEAGISHRGKLLAAMAVMAVGVVLLGASANFARLMIQPPLYWLLLALLMFTVLRRCATAVFDPAPGKVQIAVKHSILSLIWLDAATAIAVAGPAYGVAIAALLIPALLLGRWVYST